MPTTSRRPMRLRATTGSRAHGGAAAAADAVARRPNRPNPRAARTHRPALHWSGALGGAFSMYAIVRVGGKQDRVEKGDQLVVDRMHEDEGAKVTLEPLLISSDDAVFDADGLSKVKVEAVVTAHQRGEKIRIRKFTPRRGYQRPPGHRSEQTVLEIADIKLLSRKPAAKKDKEEAGNGS